MVNRKSTPEARFWNCVTKTPTCWFWTGYVGNNGYGNLRVNYAHVPAHRFSYALLVGPIPDGLIVMHSCDTPLCVNPEHLSVGTNADNKRDCVAKRRHVHGTTHPRSKLNHDQVREIRAAEGQYRDIAARFGIHASTVGFVKTGRTWRHV